MAGNLHGLAPLLRLPLMARLLERAARGGQKVYLTGGYLRDRFLRRRPKGELDLTVADPTALLADFPLAPGESSFLMDDERETWRLVLSSPSPVSFLDVTRLRGDTIDEDLRLRDFTVNALAVELPPDGLPGDLLDPAGGREDLTAGILRACYPAAMDDDPLRALRGVRFSAGLGFTVEPHTLVLMGKAGRSLASVSGERIRDELFQVLGGPAPYRGLRTIVKLGLLGFLGPEFRPPGPSSTISLRRCLDLLEQFPPGSTLSRRLAGDLQAGVSRRALLLLCTFLTDGGAAAHAKELGRNLVLGRAAKEALRSISSRTLPKGWDKDPRLLDSSAFLDLFNCCDKAIDEIALLQACSITPAAARSGAVRSFLRSYSARRRRFLRPPLLTGREALVHLPLVPGPELGTLLASAKRAQDLGLFRNRREALAWARNYLQARDG